MASRYPQAAKMVPRQPQSDAMRQGVFVAHEGGGRPILLVGWCDGARRSRVVSEIRALGLIQQLAAAAGNDRDFRVWDDAGIELGVIRPRYALTMISDLADAVRENRAAVAREVGR